MGQRKFEDFQEFSGVIKQAFEKNNIKHQHIIRILPTACIVTFSQLESLHEHKISKAVEKAASLAAYSSVTGEKIPPNPKKKADTPSKNPLPKDYDLNKPFSDTEVSSLQAKPIPKTEAPATVYVASRLPKHKRHPYAALLGEIKTIEKTKGKHGFSFCVTFVNNKSAILAHVRKLFTTVQ